MALGGRGVAPLEYNLATRWKRVFKFNPDAVPQEGTTVCIAQETVWAPQSVMIFWRRKDTLALTDTRSHYLSARNVVAMLNTLLRMEYIN